MQRVGLGVLLCHVILAVAFVLATCSCKGERAAVEKEGRAMTIQLTSTAFTEGSPIPSEYTCDGTDISPALKWSNVPEHARSLALICDDPDAPLGTWVHWVLFNVPPSTTELAKAVPSDEVLEGGATQGKNDFGRLGYGGPCPPRGKHRYFFKLYALDAELDLAVGAKKKDVEKAMQGHILAHGQLMGTYTRR